MTKQLFVSLNVLNVIDAAATLFFVCVLGGEETIRWNALFIAVSPAVFLVAKLGVVGVGSYFLYRLGFWGALLYFNALYVAALGMHAAWVFTAVSHA